MPYAPLGPSAQVQPSSDRLPQVAQKTRRTAHPAGLFVSVGHAQQPGVLPGQRAEGQAHRQAGHQPHGHGDVRIAGHRKRPGETGALAEVAQQVVDAPGRVAGGGDDGVKLVFSEQRVQAFAARVTTVGGQGLGVGRAAQPRRGLRGQEEFLAAAWALFQAIRTCRFFTAASGWKAAR